MISTVKSVVSFILIFAILVQTFGKVIIYADYIINKEEITKMFCVNKSKPKMNCNGKCHLKKQLKEQDKKEQSPVNPVKEVKDFQLFQKNTTSLSLNNTVVSYSSNTIFNYLESITEKHLTSVFHPPLV